MRLFCQTLQGCQSALACVVYWGSEVSCLASPLTSISGDSSGCVALSVSATQRAIEEAYLSWLRPIRTRCEFPVCTIEGAG